MAVLNIQKGPGYYIKNPLDRCLINMTNLGNDNYFNSYADTEIRKFQFSDSGDTFYGFCFEYDWTRYYFKIDENTRDVVNVYTNWSE